MPRPCLANLTCARVPCPPQLSPRFQAVLAAALVLPITLFSRQLQHDISGSPDGADHGGGWWSAAAVGVASSLVSVALSCATDLHCRRAFMRQEREQERTRQQEMHGEERRARGGGSEERYGSGSCKWETEE